MKIFVSVLLLALTGCASATIYELSSTDHWASYSSSCSGPQGTYERRLGDGVFLSLVPRRAEGVTRVGLFIQLDSGRTFQFTGSEIDVITENSAEKYVLDRVRSGFQADTGFFKSHSVPFIEYDATSLLTGTDRFLKIPPPIGPRDRFQGSIPIAKGEIVKFKLQLPSVRANGVLQKLQPVAFEYRQVSYAQCLQ